MTLDESKVRELLERMQEDIRDQYGISTADEKIVLALAESWLRSRSVGGWSIDSGSGNIPYADRRISQRRKEKDVTQVNMAIDYRKTNRRIAAQPSFAEAIAAGGKVTGIAVQDDQRSKAGQSRTFARMPNPTPMDLVDPLFNIIWSATKTWDVNAPEFYDGYCGMNGSHVMLIVQAIRATPATNLPEQPKQTER